MSVRACALSLAILLTATVPNWSAEPPGDCTRELAALRSAWVDDLHRKQLDSSINLYAADAVFFNPDGSTARGTAEIRTLFDTVMKTFNSDILLHSRSVETSGNLAYDSGDFKETLTKIADGSKIEASGNYLMVLRRAPEGNWTIVQHMWTQLASPAASTGGLRRTVSVVRSAE